MTTVRVEVRDEILRLMKAHGGVLQPAVIVDTARDETSVLHDCFEWNDGVAAEKFRLEQARHLVRRVTVVTPTSTGDVTHRVAVSLPSDRADGGGYRALVDVLNDEALRAQLLADAFEDMKRFRAKYGRLKELAHVFEAMGEVETHALATTHSASV